MKIENLFTKIMNDNKYRRKKRVRARVKGTRERLRLAVFRSNRSLFAQIIDDESEKTILGLGDKSLKKTVKAAKKSELAKMFGKEFAKLAKEKNIKKIVFDRSHYAYHGRVKSFAEGAREGGLEF